jgi:DNA-binding ferritin-like protein
MSADHIHFFLQLRNQIKLYHWQTRVYARHIATDKILEQLDTAIDSFVEIYVGKYGRNRVTGKNAIITLHNLTEAGAVKLLQSSVKYIQGTLTKSLKEHDTDLTNLRDEMVGQLHQLLYLFSLK